MDILTPIFDNIIGYDLVIIMVAIGNAAYFFFILSHAKRVAGFLSPVGYLPDDEISTADTPLSKREVKEKRGRLRRMREVSERYHAMYVNLTGIFPLLGILGTVIALIPMVQGLDAAEQHFFIALTSTLWGLIFAIIFKLLDGVVTPKIERNIRGIEEYLERLDSMLTQANPRIRSGVGVRAGEPDKKSLSLYADQNTM